MIGDSNWSKPKDTSRRDARILFILFVLVMMTVILKGAADINTEWTAVFEEYPLSDRIVGTSK